MFPMKFYNFDAKLELQRILINCVDLGVSKEINLFTLCKNRMGIEFTKDLGNKYELIA